MAIKPSTTSETGNTLINKYIDTAYDNVKLVADNISSVNSIATEIVPVVAEILAANDKSDEAVASAAAALISETNAALSEDNALIYLNDFKARYYGPLAADPVLDPLGGVVTEGDLYFNTVENELRFWSGTIWVPVQTIVTSGLLELDILQWDDTNKQWVNTPFDAATVLSTNALNTTHRLSDGKNHSDVVLNNAHRLSDGKNHSDVVLNNAHRVSDGSDHGFIDQGVLVTSTPQFKGLQFDITVDAPAYVEGLMFYDKINKTHASYSDEADATLQHGQELWLRGKNTTGSTILNGTPICVTGYDLASDIKTIGLAQSNTGLTANTTIAIATHDIENGTIGIGTRTGTVRDLNTSGFANNDVIYLSATTPGGITNVIPDSPNFVVRLGLVIYSHLTAGKIEVKIDTEGNRQDVIKVFNGGILESHVIGISSDGINITLTLEKEGGGDLSLFFDATFINFDSTPIAGVILTPGTDPVPILNYIYILKSTLLLTANTTGFPTTEQFTPIATVYAQSAASVQLDGVFKAHAWTDHMADLVGEGHIQHLNQWIRHQHATYMEGAVSTFTGSGTGLIQFAVTSAIIMQLHHHAFPAIASPATIYCVNDPDTKFRKITNIADLLKDSTGASLTGRTYAIVFWAAVNEAATDCKIFCNVPAGSEGPGKPDLVRSDLSKDTDYGIPKEFKGVGFLLYRLVIQNTTDSTWTLYLDGPDDDLRGTVPGNAAGSSTAIATSFPDSVFRVEDDADITKKLAFELASLTTGTTRTLAIPNRSGDIQVDPTTINTSSYNYPFPRVTTTEMNALVGMGDGASIYNTTEKAIYTYNATTTQWEVSSGGGSIISVNETAHSQSVGSYVRLQIATEVVGGEAKYILAQANQEDNADCLGIIISITTDSFKVQELGEIELTLAQVNAFTYLTTTALSTVGWIPGNLYHLDPLHSGCVTDRELNVADDGNTAIVKPMLLAITATKAQVLHMRGGELYDPDIHRFQQFIAADLVSDILTIQHDMDTNVVQALVLDDTKQPVVVNWQPKAGSELTHTELNFAGITVHASNPWTVVIGNFGAPISEVTAPVASDVNPLGLGVADPGVSNLFARYDHVHDDYEEGTWTPTIYGSTTPGTPTYLVNEGSFVKIGSIVSISAVVKISAKGGLVGTVKIAGLPFVAASVISYQAGTVGHNAGLSVAVGENTSLIVYAGATELSPYIWGTSLGTTTLTDIRITDAYYIILTCTYEAV